MNPSKMLIVGLGGIGQRHARNLRSILGENVEILAYRVRRQNHVLSDTLQVLSDTGLEEQYAIRSFDDLDAALRERPTAALICNPSSLHIPIALACAKAGCHLLIEKPVSDSLAGIDELIQEVESRGLTGMVAYQLRFHPCLQRLEALLVSKAVGRVVAVKSQIGENLTDWHKYEDYRIMYASRRDLGGGVLLSQIHEFDYLYWLWGVPKRLLAIGGKLSQLEIDVEDVASVLMGFEEGGREFPVHLHADYLQRPPTRTCEVIGDSGKILVDLRAASVVVYNAAGETIETTSYAGFERNQMFKKELNLFLDCVAGSKQPLVSLRDGLQSLRMALAARESLETGKVIEFAEFGR